jgi:hypothetical protein
MEHVIAVHVAVMKDMKVVVVSWLLRVRTIVVVLRGANALTGGAIAGLDGMGRTVLGPREVCVPPVAVDMVFANRPALFVSVTRVLQAPNVISKQNVHCGTIPHVQGMVFVSMEGATVK